MKKYSIISLLIICSAFASCDDDEVEPDINSLPDTESPVLKIEAPVNGDSVLIIDRLVVYGQVTDDKGLSDLKTDLTDPTGASSQIAERIFERQNVRLHEHLVQIPMDQNTLPGDYTLTIVVTDRGNNVTKENVNFRIHASALALADFIYPFISTAIFSDFDWFGPYELNEKLFHSILFDVVNTDAENWISEKEWKQFTIDFGLHEDNWQKWDVNGDNKIVEEEFSAAAKSLNFFNDWDYDKNGIVYEVEFAKGVFISWDLNKDNLLSREEYLGKFYTYLNHRSK